jgi:hypothetical protein
LEALKGGLDVLKISSLEPLVNVTNESLPLRGKENSGLFDFF